MLCLPFFCGGAGGGTGIAVGEIVGEAWGGSVELNWRRAAIEICRARFLFCSLASCGAIALGLPTDSRAAGSTNAPRDTAAPFQEIVSDQELDRVSGWIEVSTGYGLEELRRYSEGENPVLRDSFGAAESLYWSMAGMLDVVRDVDANDTLQMATKVRTTRYAISRRTSKTELEMDLRVRHAFQDEGPDLIAGVQVEEVVRSSSRSRTKMIVYGISNMPLDRTSSLQARIGLRRIEDHEDATVGRGTEFLAKVSRKLGTLISFNVRARHYREHWLKREQGFRMNSAGATIAYKPRGPYGIRLSGFVTERHYGVSDAAASRVRDDQWGGNLNIDYDPAPNWSIEAETSVKKRNSNFLERDRNDRLISLSVRYRL